MNALAGRRAGRVICLAFACLLSSCTFEDQVIPDGEGGANAFGLSRHGSAEELFFEALQLQSQGLITPARMEIMRRQMAVVDEVYAQDADHETLLRDAVWSHLKLAAAEVRHEDRPVVEALEGRAYARRMHQAGLKAARQGASGAVLIAGMLGVPTSKEDALLMVAIPVGGYLVVKVAGMVLKRAAFLLRYCRRADEVVERASELGFKVQRVADSDSLRTAIAKEDAVLAGQFEEVLGRIPQTEARGAVGSRTAPITSMREVEVRSQRSPTLEIDSLKNVEIRSQASQAHVVQMSNAPRSLRSTSGQVFKSVDLESFSGWIRRAQRKPARNSSEAYRYQQLHAGPEEILLEGGGRKVWADGVRPDTARLVEVKFIKDPKASPFIPGSQCPEEVRAVIVEEITTEFQRYAAVLADPSTPAVGLEVIINDAQAKPFFESVLRTFEIPGEVLVRPQRVTP